MAIALTVLTSVGLAATAEDDRAAPCNQTAFAAFKACQYQRAQDFWIATGNCFNIADRHVRRSCFRERRAAGKEQSQECKAQRQARL
jgi:hypothetical protein